MKRFALPLAALFLACSLASADDKLVVHEWGTFTSLQDEAGNAIGGINTDDEPVPDFVHRLAYNIVLSSNAFQFASKGIMACHPDVTMRLETPVLYFHPPAGWKPRPVDVHVAFRGGWLTEFYPDAIFRAPDFFQGPPGQVYSNAPNSSESHAWAFGRIGKQTVGELSWKSLALGVAGPVPATTEKVWLAPRGVDASPVATAKGEHEKFLFYRGVGNVDSPLRVARNGDQLEVSDNPRNPMESDRPQEDLRVHAAWLVEIKPDGGCAFRTLGALEQGAPLRASLPAVFPQSDFQPANLSQLKEQMRGALVAEGLFADEAAALLNTWQVSYFKSPGLRFFYLCPRADVESILPLDVSVPSQINRVMIGRIELVTPEQRDLLKQIAAAEASSVGSLDRFPEYLKLGRFRNALVLNEEKRHPSASLREFIAENRLAPYPVD